LIRKDITFFATMDTDVTFKKYKARIQTFSPAILRFFPS